MERGNQIFIHQSVYFEAKEDTVVTWSLTGDMIFERWFVGKQLLQLEVYSSPDNSPYRATFFAISGDQKDYHTKNTISLSDRR